MKRLRVIALASALGLALVGCTESSDERNLRLSIECRDEGGVYKLAQEGTTWTNEYFVCDFSECESNE